MSRSLLSLRHLDRVSSSSEWDVVNFGPCWDFCSTRKWVASTPHSTLVQSLSPCCTHSYSISRRGALQMLLLSRRYLTSVDLLFSLAHRTGRIRMFSTTPMLWTQRRSAASSHDRRRSLPECDDKEGWYWPNLTQPCDYIRGRRCIRLPVDADYRPSDARSLRFLLR